MVLHGNIQGSISPARMHAKSELVVIQIASHAAAGFAHATSTD